MMKSEKAVAATSEVKRGTTAVIGHTLRPYLVATPPATRVKACVLLQEGEDAKLTGMTRSLTRRLMGLNVGGSLLPGKTALPSKSA